MPFYRTSAAGAVFWQAMLLRLLTASALVAALGPAAATAAAAPSIDAFTKPCYVAAQPAQTEPVAISGHGFAPFADIDVFVDNVQQFPPLGTPAPQADGAGNVTGSVPAPYIQLGARQFTVRLTEHANINDTATMTGRVTALSVEQLPAKARTRARVRFRGRGFTAPGPVYAHYVYKGLSHKTVRVAVPQGACGDFSRRMRQFPFKHSPRVGTWTIQFDQQPRYGALVDVTARLTVKVNRAIHGAR
jgi:hypothetical protein